jgi:L-lactate dehydrogenase complex protein LldG
MYEQFKARAEGVSAEVFRFSTRMETVEFISGFLRREGISDVPGSYALWAESPFLDGINRQPLLEIAGLKFEVTRDLAAAARFGISQMNWAMADTGTLVQDSSAVQERLVSSLTEIHIALISTNSILPDMPTLLTRLHPDESAYIAMITGPSRTADIERVLTIGVHGPSRLVIVFCDELEGAN